MPNRRKLSLTATTEALRLRRSLAVGLQDAVCIYDIADKLGIDVRFKDLGSLEGLYLKLPKRCIVVSSLRPPGRQAYTCAHELGHHVFGHGSHFSEALEDAFDQGGFTREEYLADAFAGFFLMPKTAVSHAFAARGWRQDEPTSHQIYTIAGWFGVGYTTLIHHMSRTLSLISPPYAAKLLKHQPKEIRAALLGDVDSTGLIIVDLHWTSRPVDVQVGDYILLPPHTLIEGEIASIVREDSNGVLMRARRPGVGRAYALYSEWATYLRVSRSAYAGRAIYRHLDDPDEA